jgi:hypothetical protein
MSVNDILIAVQGSGVAHLVSKSNHLVGAGLQIVHVLGFVLLLASLVLTSLRLAGRVFAGRPGSEIAAQAGPLFAIGLTLTLASGTLMFVSAAALYYYKWAFQLKMLLLVLAIAAHVFVFRRLAYGRTPAPAAAARVGVVAVLLLWYGTALYGRLIGFT